MSLKYSVKRLPLWGRTDALDKVNFEWPSITELNLHPADTYLQKIQFKSQCSMRWISSVKCFLSNGRDSPTYENAESRHERCQLIQLPKRSVRQVSGRGGSYFLKRLNFCDQFNKSVGRYNPYDDRGHDGKKHSLEDNEELIGVYGVKDMTDYFTSFGFLVKVYNI